METIDIVICTRNRPEHLKNSLAALLKSDLDNILLGDIFVLDSSDLHHKLNDMDYGLALKSHIVQIPLPPSLSLPQKRNYFLKFHLDEKRIVIFLDDDVRVHYAALSEVVKLFSSLQCIGVGGIDQAYKVEKPRFFLEKILGSEVSTPGKLLSSGRNIQYFSTNAITRVDWLAGNFMAFRGNSLQGRLFDESRNFIGEDVDFTFRMSQKGELVVSPTVLYIHLNLTTTTTIRYHKYVDFIDHRTKLIQDFPERVKFTSTFFVLIIEQLLNLLGGLKKLSISTTLIELIRLISFPFVFLQKWFLGMRSRSEINSL